MRNLGLAVVAALLAGCAGYSITGPDGRDGYTVYEPYPYLLVTPTRVEGAAHVGDPKLVTWTAEIIYLPDRSRPYRIKTWAGFGKADFTFTFEHGWMLKGIQDKSSNEAVLKALTDLMPSPTDLLERNATGAGTATDFRPRLYRLEFDARGRVCGMVEVKDAPHAASCVPEARPTCR